MADISFSPSGYKPSSAAIMRPETAGEAFTAGRLLYRGSDGLYYKADATSAAKAAVVGMAGSGGYISGIFDLVLYDPLVTNSSAPFTSGQHYILSATAGAGNVAPITDLSAGMYAVPCMVGLSSSTALFDVLYNTAAY